MRTLAIDLETYSNVDIKKAGLYKYAENCEILLVAYAFDDEPVEIKSLATGEVFPTKLYKAIKNPDVLKTAYNAAFEMAVLKRFFHNVFSDDNVIQPEQWQCTMVQGYTLGLPGGLDRLGKALRLEEDKQKLSIGKRLITYFCKPCKPTKANGGRTRNNPEDDFEKWKQFKEYCKQDVEAERAIRNKLSVFPLNEREHKLWCLDYSINSYGVLIDKDVVNNAISFDQRLREDWLEEAKRLTDLQNPNSRAQILGWLNAMLGELESFDKAARAELLKRSDLPAEVRRVVELKNLLAKTSVKKYEAMKNAVCKDGRVRGMLQFYGANRTGRWAGRLVQLHNLPQNHLEDLDGDRALVKGGHYDLLKLMYNSPSDVLSQLIRTAFIAGKGKRFIVADFSAIEARVVAWLAGEKWRMDTFAKGGDIYCASASQMFHVPVVKHGINGHLRQKGKVAELACGYGGGVNALKAFGADKMGMTEEEMQATITHWRNASPNICKLWRELETAAKRAIRAKATVKTNAQGVTYRYSKGMLFCDLPSGRSTAYVRPRVEYEAASDKESITYEGTGDSGGWGRAFTWGGKLTENVVQSIARDCLADTMLRLTDAGYRIVMHVHDEVILEMPYGKGSLEEACQIMGQDIPWAPGLLLKADGYMTEYYKKD